PLSLKLICYQQHFISVTGYATPKPLLSPICNSGLRSLSPKHLRFSCGACSVTSSQALCSQYRLPLQKTEPGRLFRSLLPPKSQLSSIRRGRSQGFCGADFQSAADLQSACRAGGQPVRSWTKVLAQTKHPSRIWLRLRCFCGADFQSAADFESACRAGGQPVRCQDQGVWRRPSVRP